MWLRKITKNEREQNVPGALKMEIFSSTQEQFQWNSVLDFKTGRNFSSPKTE